MHIVDTTLFFSPTSGGVRRYLTAKHAWYASATNWRHTLLVPGDVDALVPGDVSTLAGVSLPGTFNYRLPLHPRRWSDALSALSPDLIEAGDAFHPAWCAWRVAQARGIPLVAFFHSNLPQLIGRRLGDVSERVVGRYVRWLYSRFDAVYAPSRLMCDYLQHLGVARVFRQPLGVDVDVFSPARRELDPRQLLGLPRDTRLLCFPGRFAGEKNLRVLYDAFAKLGAPYHLLLIGGGESRRMASNVTAIPYRRDSRELASWIASCDALVHAGTKETFGLVIVEALACGRPVVAARAGAIPELVDDSVGVLAEPMDAGSMAEAIESLYERDLDAMSIAARERAERLFSWPHAFQMQMASYSRLVHSPRAALSPAYTT